MGRIAVVVRKEIAEIAANRGLMASLSLMPVVVIASSLGVLAAYSFGDDPAFRAMAAELRPQGFEGTPQQVLLAATVRYAMGLFLMMPIFLPVPVASQSVAGEKERRTLEPLLASPITAFELMLGKSLSCVVPVLAITFVAFAVFAVGANLIAGRHFHALLVPDALFLFTVFVLAPLFSLFGTALTVLISAKVGDTRLAQTLSGLSVMVVIGVSTVQFFGLLGGGWSGFVAMALVALVGDLAMLVAAARLFDREALLTRWG